MHVDNEQPRESKIAERILKTFRAPQHDAGYPERQKIERTNAWTDNSRRLQVRYERELCHYRAFCLIALIMLTFKQVLA